jgi:peptidoglycan/LPS O-acetylase OafA/YrhL
MNLGYRPALDGLRAIAITAVVLYHAGGFAPGGYIGVDLFFVLSGFLITTLLLGEQADRGTVSLRSFYRRRALRLLPALFFLLAIFIAVSTIFAVVEDRSLRKDLFGVAAGIGYFSNIAMTGEPMTRPMPEELRHLWSLAAEEQFYLLWPAILFLVLRGRTRLALVVVAAGVALTTLRQAQLYIDGASWQRIGFGVDTRSVSILVGCLLALSIAVSRQPRFDRPWWLEPVAIVCLFGFLLVDLGRELFAGPLLVFAICSAVLITRALDDRSRLSSLLSLGALVFLGRISYSLYLWHFPVFVAFGINEQRAELAAVPAVVVAVALAVGSYYVIEVPFLRRKRRPGPMVGNETAPPEIQSARLAESRV